MTLRIQRNILLTCLLPGYNSGTVGWKRHTGQGMEKGQGDPMPSEQALFQKYPHIGNPETLQTPSVWVFMEASFHRTDCLNHWPLVIELNLPSLFPPWKVPCPLITGWLHLQPAPILQCFPNHLSNITKNHFSCFHHLGN